MLTLFHRELSLRNTVNNNRNCIGARRVNFLAPATHQMSSEQLREVQCIRVGIVWHALNVNSSADTVSARQKSASAPDRSD